MYTLTALAFVGCAFGLVAGVESHWAWYWLIPFAIGLPFFFFAGTPDDD